MSHSVVCDRCERKGSTLNLVKPLRLKKELIKVANRIVKCCAEPFSVLIKFLQDRPAGVALHGYLVNRVLIETFGSAKRLGSYILVSRETVLCSRILPGCSASSMALSMA